MICESLGVFWQFLPNVGAVITGCDGQQFHGEDVRREMLEAKKSVRMSRKLPPVGNRKVLRIHQADDLFLKAFSSKSELMSLQIFKDRS